MTLAKPFKLPELLDLWVLIAVPIDSRTTGEVKCLYSITLVVFIEVGRLYLGPFPGLREKEFILQNRKVTNIVFLRKKKPVKWLVRQKIMNFPQAEQIDG